VAKPATKAKRKAKAKVKTKPKPKPKPRPKRKRAGPKLILRERRVIPWDELTPEEQRNLEGLAREDELWRRRRKERAKLWPWRDPDYDWAEAGKVLDRAAALERYGWRPKVKPASQLQPQQPQAPQPAMPELQSQPRAKPKARVGAERDYDYDDIRRVARELLGTGTDKHRSWFYERVRNACKLKRPVIRTPANDRTMSRIIGDLYSTPKASPSQD
jgi:hypothetical protein